MQKSFPSPSGTHSIVSIEATWTLVNNTTGFKQDLSPFEVRDVKWTADSSYIFAAVELPSGSGHLVYDVKNNGYGFLSSRKKVPKLDGVDLVVGPWRIPLASIDYGRGDWMHCFVLQEHPNETKLPDLKSFQGVTCETIRSLEPIGSSRSFEYPVESLGAVISPNDELAVLLSNVREMSMGAYCSLVTVIARGGSIVKNFLSVRSFSSQSEDTTSRSSDSRMFVTPIICWGRFGYMVYDVKTDHFTLIGGWKGIARFADDQLIIQDRKWKGQLLFQVRLQDLVFYPEHRLEELASQLPDSNFLGHLALLATNNPNRP